ncbi:MAG: pyridoxal phosphate-dependent aminotransferase, partial [Methanothrix sp.]|nr:pyridoxal phosphate-dependent aminotransferase [Methanothrix sp.]
MIARRAEEIAPFIAMEVLEKAREMERRGIDIIHLEVGEPDFDVPPAVKEATCRALEEGLTHYAQRAGIAALQETKSDVA